MKQEITEAAVKWFLNYEGKDNHGMKSDEEVVSIWIQEVVMKWWAEIGEDKRQQYRGEYHLIDEEMICTAYLKEQENKEPVSDGILSDEEAARRVDWDLYPNNEAGAFDYMDNLERMEERLWDKENDKFLSKEPSNVSVESMIKSLSEYKDLSVHDKIVYIGAATVGANWQKEQDRLLVEDMLDVIRMFNATMTAKDYTERAFKAVESAITKAEQYLNQ